MLLAPGFKKLSYATVYQWCWCVRAYIFVFICVYIVYILSVCICLCVYANVYVRDSLYLFLCERGHFYDRVRISPF
jgi:hypothetical protein